MMAVGIMGAISLGVVELSKNIFQLDRRMAKNVVVANLKTNIKNSFRAKEVCEKNFKGLNPRGTEITELKDLKDNVFLEKDGVIGQRVSSIKITEIKIQDMPTGATEGLPALANLSIKYENLGKKGIILGRKEFQIYIPILVIEKASVVETCFTTSDSYVFASCIALKGRDTGSICKNIAIEDDLDDANTPIHQNIIDVDGYSSNKMAVSALGDVKTETTLGVGLGAIANPTETGSFSAAGNLTVGQDFQSNSLGLGADPSTATGSTKIAKSLSVGDLSAPNTDGYVYVKDSVSVGDIAPPGNSGIRISGKMGIGVNAPVSDSNTSLKTYNRIKIKGSMPEIGLDDSHVLTKIWFTNQLAETLGLDSAARDNIEEQLKNPEESATIKKVSQQVCSQMRIDGKTGSWNTSTSTCSIGIHEYSLSVSGKNIILSTPQGNKTAKFYSCSESGTNCTQVCSGSSCWTTWGNKCPTGKAVVGIYNGIVKCANDKP